MSGCEKCWKEAYRRSLKIPHKSWGKHYLEIMAEKKGNPCSVKEQAGRWWDEERQIDTRDDHYERD